MHKERLIILIAVIAVVAGFLYWYFVFRVNAPLESPLAEEPASLGGQIGAEAQNPIRDDLPTFAPDVNPIDGLYKNPFE